MEEVNIDEDEVNEHKEFLASLKLKDDSIVWDGEE
jgi:hypothetical protein